MRPDIPLLESVLRWDEYSDDYDPWITLDQAEAVTKKSGIRIDRNKELIFIAIEDADVIGAVWYSVTDEDLGQIFDFDVAVHPQYRSGRIGLELIEAAISEYHDLKSAYDMLYIRVNVINPKLARVLERKYGFDVESEYSGGAIMTYHG